ncbi:pentapeptide repeat-containing protein [Mycoplana rhizolycopersici]|uniref:Pentapeptide repeat-containing protein n=1 Tax=Mycoplana rhizolycopersici TaxID=2746702 RepID=A0ABX2QMD5_9HYPH|nr:pentapeptide repeat-containing protein [Rhizobium rhizolycopersici]NVP57511.1 pentapeptide repeat-containing protein [Rhizobium rhizolycopersici]
MSIRGGHQAHVKFRRSSKALSLQRKAGLGSAIVLGFLALSVPCVAVILAGRTAAAADCGSTPEPGIDWAGCKKRAIMLQGSNMRGANLGEADLALTDLSRTNLTSANLEKANLSRAWFTGATLTKANFNRVEAYRVGFEGVAANGATFASAELQRANFKNASLAGVDFEKAELGRADFRGAVISGASFPLANLSRADFSKATFDQPLDFSQAFMFLTRIEGLDLTNAKGLSQEQVNLACGDGKTRLPAGLTAPSNWPCPFD